MDEPYPEERTNMSDETQMQDEENIEPSASEAETDAEAATVESIDPQAARIAELEAEVSTLKDQVLRTLADTENVRKRSQKEVAEARIYAVEKFALDLLAVSDNLSSALDVLSEEDREALSEKGKNLLEGVEMTQKNLHAIFARNNVVAMDASPGVPFDPNMHEAVSRIPSDAPAQTIAAVFQTGWKIKDRTLRAAMVAVSLGPAQS